MRTSSKWILRVLWILLGIIVIGAVVILGRRHKNLVDGAGTSVKTSLIVTSTSVRDGGRIPDEFACERVISPALSWSDPPVGTQTFAIIVQDPDAPLGIHSKLFRVKRYWQRRQRAKR